MKSNSLKILILIGFLIPSAWTESQGQKTSLQGFSLKVSPGALVYYGDLSTNDLNLPKRIFTGSKFGIGASMIKQFSPFFGIQALFMAGSLYTAASDNSYFTGSLTEFSLSARFDPLKLLKDNSFPVSPYASVGVATFGFRSVRREIGTNVVLLPNFGYENDGLTKTTRQTAMSMPIAIGLSYRILPYLQLELEHSIRMTNTDLIDCFKGPNTANDLYSLTSIGFRFSIPSKSTAIPPAVTENQAVPMLPRTDSSEINMYVDCQIPETIAAGKSFTVNIRILKGKYSGPGKLIQKYPEGFTTSSDNTHEYTLTFNNQNVIVDWTNMPADSVVTLKYDIQTSDKVSGNQSIAERFEYEELTGPKTIRFNDKIFVENLKQAGGNDDPANQVVKPSGLGESVKAAPFIKANIRKSEALPGIEFRVQCGAFRDKNKADTHLAAKYKISEIIQEEYTDQWYKYTVGSFPTYEEAARYRDQFISRTGILSSFIVVYKNGKRLSNIADAYK